MKNWLFRNRTQAEGVVLVFLVLAILVMIRVVREPRIEGKPLTVWLNQIEIPPYYDPENYQPKWPDLSPSEKAFLLDALSNTGSGIATAYRHAWFKLPEKLQNLLPEPTIQEDRLMKAAYALGQTGKLDPTIEKALLAAFDDLWADARTEVLKALFFLKTDFSEQIDKLKLAIQDANYPVRTAAIVIISRRLPPDNELVPLLIGCLRDQHFHIKEMAANFLQQHPEITRKYAEQIRSFINDPNKETRDFSLRVLQAAGINLSRSATDLD